MKVYCTSSSGLSPMLYLGTDLDAAVEAVGDFVKYEKPFNQWEFVKHFVALPKEIDFKILHYYMADGWWYTVVEFEIN